MSKVSKLVVSTALMFLSANAVALVKAPDKPVLPPVVQKADPLSVPSAIEQEESEKPFTASFSLTSNYVFRGISQTSNLPAVQGGFTYTFLTPGIYFNLWGSNVNFLDLMGNVATVEFDQIVGIKNTFKDLIEYDFSFAHYSFPKTRASYNEALFNLAIKFLYAKFGYSPNVYNTHQSGTYYSGGVTFDVPEKYAFHLSDVNFTAGAGHYSLPKVAGNSYNDFLVQISKGFWEYYTLALSWTGTNGHANLGTLDDDHFIATLTVDV